MAKATAGESQAQVADKAAGLVKMEGKMEALQHRLQEAESNSAAQARDSAAETESALRAELQSVAQAESALRAELQAAHGRQAATQVRIMEVRGQVTVLQVHSLISFAC